MLKDRLQHWLTQTGTSRAELAEKLHVSKRTVDNWLGQKSRPIPGSKQAVIEAIIAPQSLPGHIAVNIPFTEDQWQIIADSIPEGVDKKEYVKNILLAMFKAARIPEPPEQQ